MKRIAVAALVLAHVFAAGFWAGNHWQENYGPLPDLSQVEAFRVCSTKLDTPEECALKMLKGGNSWTEDEWELRDRRIAK